MLQTVRGEKVDEKKWIICLVSMFPCWVWFSIVEKKVFFQFCTDHSKKSNSITAIYIYALKVLITFFLKMIWFIGFWATVHEILAVIIPKKILTQQKFNEILPFQILISPKY